MVVLTMISFRNVNLLALFEFYEMTLTLGTGFIICQNKNVEGGWFSNSRSTAIQDDSDFRQWKGNATNYTEQCSVGRSQGAANPNN